MDSDGATLSDSLSEEGYGVSAAEPSGKKTIEETVSCAGNPLFTSVKRGLWSAGSVIKQKTQMLRVKTDILSVMTAIEEAELRFWICCFKAGREIPFYFWNRFLNLGMFISMVLNTMALFHVY